MVTIESAIGVDNYRPAGNVVDGITFEGNGAGWGVYLLSVYGCQLNDLTFNGAFNSGSLIEFDVLQSTSFADSTTTQGCITRNLTASTTGSSNGLKLDEWSNSSNGGNASYNYFYNGYVSVGSGIGILCIGCDNNYFSQYRVYTDVGGGYTDSVDLQIYFTGSPTDCTGGATKYCFPANGNHFDHLFYNGYFYARGTPTASGCAPFTYGGSPTCTYANILTNLDSTNGPTPPVTENGAELSWSTDEAKYLGPNVFVGQENYYPGAVFTPDTAESHTCPNAAHSYSLSSPTYAIWLCDQTYLAMFDNANNGGISRIGLAWVGSGSTAQLSFGQVAGTGGMVFDASVNQFDSSITTYSDGAINIGAAGTRIGNVFAQAYSFANASHNFGITATGASDSPFVIAHDGTTVFSLSTTGGLTLPSLATSGTIAGALCATSAGVLIQHASADCFTASLTVGSTSVGSGTSGYVLSDNGGTLGNIAATISGVTLGNNLNTLSFGTYLTASGSSYNGTSGVTIATNATSADTASTLMARDGSGNVSANIFTGATGFYVGSSSQSIFPSGSNLELSTASHNLVIDNTGHIDFDGNVGATGTCSAVTTITVVAGLIISCN